MYQRALKHKKKDVEEDTFLLPSIEPKRVKPTWAGTSPSFIDSNKRILGPPIAVDVIGVITSKRPTKVRKSKDDIKYESSKRKKKEQESFRKYLVDIITKGKQPIIESYVSKNLPPLTEEGTGVGISQRERSIARYYYYIYNGIDTDHVAPMEESWMTNMKRRIRPSVKAEANEKLMEQIEDEIREDYLLSVKKAIVDFVLKDPSDPNIDGLHKQDTEETAAKLEHRRELEVVPKPWHSSFLNAQRFCRVHLHVTNRCMLQVLDLWFSQFHELRLIDPHEFYKKTSAMELSTFQHACVKNIDSAKEILLKKWLNEVQGIFYQGNRRGYVPANSEMTRLEEFFRCAAVLMTGSLQLLGLNSMQDFTLLLCSPPRLYERITADKQFSGHISFARPKTDNSEQMSGFILRLVLEDKQIKFDPTIEEFEESMMSLFDRMLQVVQSIPRIETRLYADWQGVGGEKVTLHPVILPEVFESYKNQVKTTLKKESRGPEHYLQTYNKYGFLINRQAELDIEALLNPSESSSSDLEKKRRGDGSSSDETVEEGNELESLEDADGEREKDHVQHADNVNEGPKGPSFDDLTGELLRYRHLTKKIQYESRRTIRLGLFEVHADELIRALVKRAEGIADKVLDRILEEHRNINRS